MNDNPMPDLPQRRHLVLALSLALASPILMAQQVGSATNPAATGQDNPQNPADPRHHRKDDPHADDLGRVEVTASPIGNPLARPVSVLAGEKLDEARAGNLGDTISTIPGVQSSNFGAGVGRPIIRGMDGPRVAVLSNGMATQDVSTVSQDHSPAVEPFLADQIEVLKGPSTLLFGSGAIGGAVNVVDGRIPELPIANGIEGRTELRYDSASHGNTGMFRLDGGNNRFALHADGVRRHDGDYAIPHGTQANSYVHTGTGSLGASLLGDWGFVGINASRYLDHYGNPGEPGEPGVQGSGVHLQMRQDRYELRGGLPKLWAGGGLKFSFAHTDYNHVEFEGATPGTTFFKKANEGRIEGTFDLAGWKSALGMQASNSSFRAIGEEAFIVPTTTHALGIFAVAKRSWQPIDVELGLRGDNVRSRTTSGLSAKFHPLSASMGASWKFAQGWRLNLNLDHAERAPAEEELFANGPHIATLAFERGSPALKREASNQADLGVKYFSDRFDVSGNVYVNRVNGFIYLADTSETWHWDEGGRDLPVRQWTQGNARFRGAEADATWHLTPDQNQRWDVRMYGDMVRATLANGENLPRIAPSRLGAQLRFEQGAWRASLGAVRVNAQNRVAPGETSTPGYTSIDAHAAYHVDDGGLSWEIFADGRNLTNQVQRVHTSFLKDDVVLPGRGFSLGVRAYF